MILDSLLISKEDLFTGTGWLIKQEGACKGDLCVPLGQPVSVGDMIDVRALATMLDMPLIGDDHAGVWVLGREAGPTAKALTTARAPELELPDVDGVAFRLSSLVGQKVLLVAWASWCGCRLDLPFWAEVRDELQPSGLEIVTVALDVDLAAARLAIEAARPQHPALIDAGHTVDSLFGIVNVPAGVWIDELGIIVRPAEPAWPGRVPGLEQMLALDPAMLPPNVSEMVLESRKLRTDPEGYMMMLRDWVTHGAESPYALSPDEVIHRSHPLTSQAARAAAEFEFGEYFHRCGIHAAAVQHWREAHRLQPDNWTYRRQAWNFEDPVFQGWTGAYDSCWIDDFKAIGAENYYPPLQP